MVLKNPVCKLMGFQLPFPQLVIAGFLNHQQYDGFTQSWLGEISCLFRKILPNKQQLVCAFTSNKGGDDKHTKNSLYIRSWNSSMSHISQLQCEWKGAVSDRFGAKHFFPQLSIVFSAIRWFQTNLPSLPVVFSPPRIVSATSCYTSALLEIFLTPKMWEQWLGSMLIALASRIWIRCWRLGWGFWVKEDFPPKMWWWICFWKGVLASKKCPETFRLRNCRWVFPERLEWRKLGGCEVHLSWECLLGTFREAFFAYIKFSMHSCPSAMFHEWLEKKTKKTKQHFPTKKKTQQAKFMVLAISIAQFSCFFFPQFFPFVAGFSHARRSVDLDDSPRSSCWPRKNIEGIGEA